ncbi:hypothetical protein FB45DRAFT_734501 [Roridomyces roridus]|uniref:Arrestin-like N-terminal domain-containing protein n=1 Tax=Roridomyces roridus TaxID=1738132 RepID=A0AAD7FX95_9AGAR|nr:hypothetical protein FB45DRAFT_734501 [Roridomyces roridus]
MNTSGDPNPHQCSPQGSGEVLTLHFADYVRVAGELLQGQVDIDLAKAAHDKIENVRVKLREGASRRQRDRDSFQTQTVQLVREDQTIWDQFNAPPTGAQVVSCPFQLRLPPNLPPSFHYHQFSRSVAITYSIEVVGSRHGLLHANRRVRKVISVVPAASEWELGAASALRQGWAGPWKPFSNNKDVRHGILIGEHSQVKMELTVPDLPSYPMGLGIPFKLAVLTHTKPVHEGDLEHKHGKLFPPPPESSSKVEARIYRRGRMHVRNKSEDVDEHYDLQGSLGDEAGHAAVQTTFDDPVFAPTPEHGDKGVWTRGVRFEGNLFFPYTPTFSAETVEWQYTLRLKVDFPGLGNHLELEVPIHIDSGCGFPPPFQGGWQPNAMYTLATGPPPMIKLPSGYWNGDDHDWDEDN